MQSVGLHFFCKKAQNYCIYQKKAVPLQPLLQKSIYYEKNLYFIGCRADKCDGVFC